MAILLKHWKSISALVLIGLLTYIVNDYINQRGKIKDLKAEVKTLTDSTAALTRQTKELTQARFNDSVNFANRELGYQTTIASQTKTIKAKDKLIADLTAGIMCKESYGWPIKNKTRIVPCNE